MENIRMEAKKMAEENKCFEQLGQHITDLDGDKIHHFTALYVGQEIYIDGAVVWSKNKIKAKISYVDQGQASAVANGLLFNLNYISGEWRCTGCYNDDVIKDLEL